MMVGGFVPRAAETEEQKKKFAGDVVGVERDRDSEF
jgi:hypothetical protein